MPAAIIGAVGTILGAIVSPLVGAALGLFTFDEKGLIKQKERCAQVVESALLCYQHSTEVDKGKCFDKALRVVLDDREKESNKLCT